MSDVVVPDCVTGANIRKGRFIVVNKDGTLYTQTSCVHFARDYGDAGYTVWKLTGVDHIPPFKAFGV